jgi:starch synthase
VPSDRPLRIVQIASEVAPYAKTGGLADVAGALSRALAARGHDVHVILPLHGTIDRQRFQVRPTELYLPSGLPGQWEGFQAFRASPEGTGPTVWMLGHPLFNRAGLYGDLHGEFGDNHVRFAGFCHAALELIRQRFPSPDVIHLHDWQTGLAAAYLRAPGLPRDASFDPTKVVFTIHNLNFTGSFPLDSLDAIGLPRWLGDIHGLEFYGGLSLLKAGLLYADELTTVSPRYAYEIQTSEFGAGFDGLLRGRQAQLHGILNGIDEEEWNPATDSHLAQRYSLHEINGKDSCKAALQQELGLQVSSNAPLFGVVSRLAWQKGIDLVAELGESIVSQGGQLAVLGSGDQGLEAWLTDLARRMPGQCAVRLGFDEPLSHRMVAGCDMFLLPSRYEPCGLTQMYALRYGTVPVVRSVGGLDDTVEELDSARGEGTGFKFGAATASALWAAITRAWGAWEHLAVWVALAQRGMSRSFAWDVSASAYERLYEGRNGE